MSVEMKETASLLIRENVHFNQGIEVTGSTKGPIVGSNKDVADPFTNRASATLSQLYH